MAILKLEPYSGISGDMFLGALAPLLDAEEQICALPEKLGLKGVEVTFTNVIRSTIRCRKATVTVHGHAPEDSYSHGHSHDHDHSHGHVDDQDQDHDYDHEHEHCHRAYIDIVHLIGHADLSEGAKTLALEMFKKLGEAEAEMHGMELENVHFHEVGAEDSLIDLVGAAVLIDLLNPGKVYCTPVCVGSGYVKTAHGRLPVPAPATQRLLQGLPTFAGPIEKEMTTPSGAVILAVLNPDFDPPTLVQGKTGLGAGTRDLDQPNALRVSLCEPFQKDDQEAITLLQTNLDNLTGEDLGSDALQALLDDGALDAWITPILMKKGRPAHKLEVLCFPEDATRISETILKQFPTLGVRRFEGQRTLLKREVRKVDTAYGTIDVKVHILQDGTERQLPEYESCKKAARKFGVSVDAVRKAAADG